MLQFLSNKFEVYPFFSKKIADFSLLILNNNIIIIILIFNLNEG